jgi:hypothetical protein
MSQIWQVSEGILRDGDVLLEVDGYPIAPDGTVMLPEAPSLRLGILRHRVQRVAGGLKLGYADRDPDPSQHHPPFMNGGGWPLLSRSPSECRMVSLDAQKDAPAPRREQSEILVFPVERRFRHEPSFRGPGREHQ